MKRLSYRYKIRQGKFNCVYCIHIPFIVLVPSGTCILVRVFITHACLCILLEHRSMYMISTLAGHLSPACPF